MHKIIVFTNQTTSTKRKKGRDDPNTGKIVEIAGKNNRYQMTKLLESDEDPVPRIRSGFSTSAEDHSELFLLENQMIILRALIQAHPIRDQFIFGYPISKIKQQIETKLKGYRHQDLAHNRDSETPSLDFVVSLFQGRNLKCHYCNQLTFLLYKYVRDMAQWTLDRIDNSQGHIPSNVVLACLACNLHKKHLSQESFLFTKNLCVSKTELSSFSLSSSLSDQSSRIES